MAGVTRLPFPDVRGEFFPVSDKSTDSQTVAPARAAGHAIDDPAFLSGGSSSHSLSSPTQSFFFRQLANVCFFPGASSFTASYYSSSSSALPATTASITMAAPLCKQFLPLQGRTADAPLPPTPASEPGHHHPKALRGVVFDVDGTLCVPQTYMFGQMRDALGITKSVDILDHIYALPTPREQQEAMEKIRAIERAAMASQEAQPGLAPLMDYLASRGVPKAICTRNFEQPVLHLLGKFLDGHVFEPIVTRDFRPPKPDPAGILHIARSWGFLRSSAGAESDDDTADPAEVVKEQKEEEEAERAAAPTSTAPVPEADASGLIMVGDSIDDMTAGRRAGAATVLLVNDVNRHLAEHEHTDLVISQLDDLVGILEKGFVGREIAAPSA